MKPRDDEAASMPASQHGQDATGGESVCWLDRVCERCGALEDGPPAEVCWRCGAGRAAPA